MTSRKHLGVQLYSVRDDLAPEQRGDTLQRLAGMGFTHIEPYRILDDPAGLRADIDAAGLVASSAHAKLTEANRDEYLDAAVTLGIDTVILPWVEPASIVDAAGVEALADSLNELSRYSRPRGIRIGYHNHDFEFSQHIDGVSAWELLVSRLDEDVILELDTYWASVGGGDVFEILPRLRERIRFLHVKNEPPDADDPAPLGVDITGRMDEILALSSEFVELAVVEIVVDDGDVFPVLERNAAWFLERIPA
jgi:sugar phosphate isomerase/epimerase